MPHDINALTWTDTTDPALPIAVYAVSFAIDLTWRFRMEGSYHLQSIVPRGCSIDNTANGVGITATVGAFSTSVPAFQSIHLQFPANPTLLILQSPVAQTVGVEMWISPPVSDIVSQLAIQNAAASQVLPVGMIMYWPNNVTPPKFLRCDGTAVSRTTFAVLFALIGITFGPGDGVTTFNLPNLSDRMIFGEGGNAIAATGGSSTSVIGAANLPAHTHTTGGGDNGAFLTTNNPTTNLVNGAGLNVGVVGAISGASGGGPGTSTPLNVTNPFIALRPVIYTG